MMTVAVVLDEPRKLDVRSVELSASRAGDVTVDVEWSAVSTGTERLLYEGRMPAFPGMGYPLVPGYESVGRVVGVEGTADVRVGERVFVPGASCYREVRGLFGGAAARLVVPASRVTKVPAALGEDAVLLALAATASHALAGGQPQAADLIVGHGVLGRLLARLVVAEGGAPVVWETNPARRAGASGYRVVDPSEDARRDYRAIYDVSGDASQIETLLGRLARGGELVLAGFYSEPIAFAFPVAFMREAKLRVAAEWKPEDLTRVLELLDTGRFALDGLITHRRPYKQAREAYVTAFTDPECLKMLIDWRTCK